jgi:hypothetical protein
MSRLRDVLSLSGLSARDRRAIIIGLAVLLPALLYVAAVRPYRTALNDLRDRAATERALLSREEALIAAAASLPAQLDAAAERDRLATSRLVTAPNLPLAEAELTGMLASIASLSRVLLQDMRAVEPRPRTGDVVAWSTIRPLRLAVRGESDLEGVLTFLHRLEDSPLLLRIVELSIEPGAIGNSEGHNAASAVQFALIVEAYTPAGEVET